MSVSVPRPRWVSGFPAARLHEDTDRNISDVYLVHITAPISPEEEDVEFDGAAQRGGEKCWKAIQKLAAFSLSK